MPYNRQQIKRILNVGTRPLIAPDASLGLAARVTESYIRRRIYDIEDRAAIEQFNMLKQVNRDIRGFALDAAQARRLTALTISGNAIGWTREVNTFARERMMMFSRWLATHTLNAAGVTYLYSYYGRGWVLDSMTRRDVRVNLPRPDMERATRDIVQPQLAEAFDLNGSVYNIYGVEFRQRFDDIADEHLRKARSRLASAMQAEQSVAEGLQAVADVLGTSGDGTRGMAGRLSTTTRSAAQSASVSGSKAMYDANEDVVIGIAFVASNDSKVCPRCANLDGTRWALGDPDIAYPVSDTHPNCRCSLIPITANEAEINSDDPPDFTWTEWLRSNGLEWLFDGQEVA